MLHAQIIDISNPNSTYIGTYMLQYNDKNNNHSVEYIKENSDLFKPLNKNIDSRFFTRDTIWYHFKITNPKVEKIERYFVLDIPWFDDVEIFIQDDKGQSHYQEGNLFILQQRSYSTNLINIRHLFEAGISDIYIKAKTNDPFVFALSILDRENLLLQSSTKHTISFSIYSIIITMMLFNFILYFIIKHASHLYYSLFLFSFICMNMAYNNYTFEYFIGNNPVLQNWLEGLFLYIFSIMGLLFTQSFLELKYQHTKLYKSVLILIALTIVSALSTAIFAYHFFVAVGILTTFIFGLYSFCVAVYCVRQKNRSAIFFVLGVSFGLIGTMITGLSVSAVIPTFNIHMYKAIDYGIVLDTILLSIALAKRYTVLFENLQTTQNELVQLSSNLENIVHQRTNFLNRELENNKFLLKEVFHRVKNNLQIISSLLILQTKNVENPLLLKHIIEENIQRIQSISMMHEKIFTSKNINGINVKQYVKEIIFDFIDLSGFNSLSFTLKIKDISVCINTLIPIGLIMNELLTNSVKYAFNTTSHPHITIKLYTQGELIYFKYKDNGIGANLNDFTQGFGFQLLDSLSIHQLNGKREFFNQEGFNYTIAFPNKK